MSVKTKAGTVTLVAALAIGFYMFGPGSKTDNSRDKLAQVLVEWIPPSRTIEVKIVVKINGLESRNENRTVSPYDESFWLRPGEVVSVNARQRRAGKLACTIKIAGKTYGPNQAQEIADATCAMSAGNDG